ncbi:MAG: hypothetical protein GF329_19610 [Candidatus Lokiarchaeota archaeon]|nr:hypothetical protein [Candidatus Lokiarchaeota archaeon]
MAITKPLIHTHINKTAGTAGLAFGVVVRLMQFGEQTTMNYESTSFS